MTKAITLRLDDDDHEALARQAAQLRVSPGTLARMLVHAAISDDPAARRDGAQAAVARLVRGSRQRPKADAVALVHEARARLGSRG